MRNRKDLRVYQKRLVRRGYAANTAFFVDVGLGKTISALTVVDELRITGWGAAIVVAPLRVCEGVWAQEAADWQHTRGLRVVWVHGSAKRRLELFSEPADVYLINYDLLKWMAGLVREGVKVRGQRKRLRWKPPAEILILDESTYIKAPGTERFKALRFQLLKYFERVLILTGTPAPNSLLNLWSQIFCIDRGERLGTSYELFKQRFFEQDDYHGYRYVPREGARQEIYDLISDVVVRLDAKDWLELPEVIPAPTPVVLPEATLRLYRKHEREMFTELDNAKVIDSVNAAVLSMHCQQMANGAVYANPEDKSEWAELHTKKVEAVKELLDEDDSPAIIAYRFKHDRERLLAAFPKAQVLQKGNLDKVQTAWNKDKVPVLLANPASAAHGLNLQKGSGRRVIWFSLTWGLEGYLQLLGRLARSGSRHKHISSILIYARDTVDEAIMDALQRKAAGQRELLDALKRYRRRVESPNRNHDSRAARQADHVEEHLARPARPPRLPPHARRAGQGGRTS